MQTYKKLEHENEKVDFYGLADFGRDDKGFYVIFHGCKYQIKYVFNFAGSFRYREEMGKLEQFQCGKYYLDEYNPHFFGTPTFLVENSDEIKNLDKSCTFYSVSNYIHVMLFTEDNVIDVVTDKVPEVIIEEKPIVHTDWLVLIYNDKFTPSDVARNLNLEYNCLLEKKRNILNIHDKENSTTMFFDNEHIKREVERDFPELQLAGKKIVIIRSINIHSIVKLLEKLDFTKGSMIYDGKKISDFRDYLIFNNNVSKSYIKKERFRMFKKRK